MYRRTTGMMALLLAAGLAPAAEGSLDDARSCAQVQDSLQRLVCYDRLFPPAPSADATRPAAPATGVPATPGTTPAPAPAMPDQESLFGAESLKRPVGGSDADKAPRSLTATVSQVRQTRPNVFRVTLANGQVWQQMDMDSTFHVEAGDTVEIDRGRMGGYRMARTSNGGSGWVRVNRLK